MKRETFPLSSPGPSPVLLTVPGLNNSCPSHWQTSWEQKREDCYRVDLGMWDRPHRNTWLSKLDTAIAVADAPVILVAHSLGCHAVAWWNQLADDDRLSRVAGALLVAPPWVGDLAADSPLSAFAPLARDRFAFPSILAASRNDPYASFGHSRKMAQRWGSRFVGAGWTGHINTESGLGSWPYGEFLLDRLIWSVTRRHTAYVADLPVSARIRSSDIPLGL